MEPPKFLLASGAYNDLFLPPDNAGDHATSQVSQLVDLNQAGNADTESDFFGSTPFENHAEAFPSASAADLPATADANETHEDVAGDAAVDWNAVRTIELEPRTAIVNATATEASSAKGATDAEKASRYAVGDTANTNGKSGEQEDASEIRLGRLSLEQATNYLRTSSHVLLHQGEVKSSGGGFLATLRSFFGGARPLKAALLAERDFVLALALTPFSNDDPMHFRLLASLYDAVLHRECPGRFGEHWDALGFQGRDPATDLRGAGLFGLLQLFAFVTQHQQLARDIHRLSTDDEQNFPFALMGINLTSMVLSCAREHALNKSMNKRNAVLAVLNDLYAALFGRFFAVWRDGHKTIADSGNVIAELQAVVRKDPSRLLGDSAAPIAAKSRRKVSNSGEKEPVEVAEFSKI